jgi:hypothetical protein
MYFFLMQVLVGIRVLRKGWTGNGIGRRIVSLVRGGSRRIAASHATAGGSVIRP